MDLPRSEIEALASKMIDGSITAAEQERLNAWLDQQMVSNIVELDTTFADDAEQLRSRMLRHILEQVGAESPRHISRRMMHWIPYAVAAVLVAAIIGTWMIVVDGGRPTKVDVASLLDSTDIPPGGNRATLTLADGRTVNLSELHTGIIVGDEIAYLDGTEVLELGIGAKGQGQDNPAGPATADLQLTTPKGGAYQITLPDGTHVWLNSASTLTYPSRFADDERVVELKGEAYFEVSRSRTVPFRVMTKGQLVEVLGTQFNVTAYDDEQDVKTTLVSGAVRVVLDTDHQSSITLSPGQQSSMVSGKITVNSVDVGPYVAWKSGMFHFKQTPFAEMMRQIERWYDVDVRYHGRIPNETFSGRMSRHVSLMTVLDLLKVSEIQYRIEGKKLIIE